MDKPKSPLIATSFPMALFMATAIIFFTVGFIPALMLFIGGLISWLGSYQFLSAIFYARGPKKLYIPIVQAAITYGGFLILSKANFKLILFDIEVENYEFAYFSIVMGLLMAIVTRPDDDEIKRAMQ